MTSFKEQLAMYFFSIGVIDVDKNGNIWKLKDKRGGNKFNKWNTKWRDVKPRKIGKINNCGYIMVAFSIHRHAFLISGHN